MKTSSQPLSKTSLEPKARAFWSSQFAATLVTTGSAIGLGNIWKFPYMAGENGGGTFVLLYLFCVIIMGAPLLVAELFIGQKSRKDTISAYEVLDKPKTWWSIGGVLGIITSIIILSFYCIVGGWVFYYIYLASSFALSGSLSTEEFVGFSNHLMASGGIQLLCGGLFLLIVLFVSMNELNRGIERWTRWLAPVFLLILVSLLIRSLFLPGFMEAFRFIFYPRGQITPFLFLTALGLSFFKLSLGLGAMMTYGSYLNEKANPIKISLLVAASDTLIALVCGLIVFSTTFTFHLTPSSGPTLCFQTLPELFSHMPGGFFIQILFFLLMAFVALTSSLSMLEVFVSALDCRHHIPRRYGALGTVFFVFLLSMLTAFSPNILKEYTMFGLSFFDFFDVLSSNFLLPCGGLIVSLFFGWVIGKKVEACYPKQPIIRYWLLLSTRYIAPIVISLILIKTIFKW